MQTRQGPHPGVNVCPWVWKLLFQMAYVLVQALLPSLIFKILKLDLYQCQLMALVSHTAQQDSSWCPRTSLTRYYRNSVCTKNARFCFLLAFSYTPWIIGNQECEMFCLVLCVHSCLHWRFSASYHRHRMLRMDRCWHHSCPEATREITESSQHSFKGLFSEQLKTPNTLSWKTKQWCHDSEWRIRIEKSQVWKSTLGRERQNRNSDLKLKHHIPTKKKKSFFKEGVNHHLVQKRAAQCSHLWGRLDSNSDFNTREEEEIKYQEKAPMKWYYRAESCFGSQCSSHEHVGRKNF